MSWAGLTANQIVSIGNLLDAVSNSVFLTGPSAYVGDIQREVLKRDAVNYAMISTIYAPFLAKSDNQLVIKSDLVAATGAGGTVTLFYVTNSSDDVSLTDLQYNGTQVDGISYPLGIGDSAVGFAPYFGTATITVSWSSVIGGQSMQFSDSDSVAAPCMPATTGTNTYDIMSGAGLSSSAPCQLFILDGACF